MKQALSGILLFFIAHDTFISDVITLVALLILAILSGASDTMLQLIGGFAGELPLFGPWLNALTAFTRDTLTGSLNGTFILALGILIQCLSSNILDSIMIGVISSFLTQLNNVVPKLRARRLDLTAAIFSTFLGVGILYLFKKLGTVGYAITTAVAEIALMMIGLGLMLGALGGRTRAQRKASALAYMVRIAIAAIETGGMVGLFCTALVLVPLLKAGVSFGGLMLWLLFLLALVAICALVLYADDQIKKEGRRFGML